MASFAKSALFFRKASPLYLFFIVLFIFFGLFYYKYVPDNKQELNERGHRTLTQLTANFQNRDEGLHEIFDSVACNDFPALRDKEDAYERLNENIPFSVITDTLKDRRQGNSFFPLKKDLNGDWYILYPDTTGINRYTVEVGMAGFAQPVLSAGNDIFSNYFLLADTGRQTSRKSSLLQVIYRNNQMSFSDALSADTLLSLQKNTDLSGICKLNIGGATFETFWVSFDLHNQHMLLAGLIPEDDYNQRVQSTPVNFLPLSIILISLILISLPFLKIYLLSPKESINTKDVLGMAFSFYLGSSVVCIIIFYSFFVYVSDLGWKNRLVKFSDAISRDISGELDLAGKQLDRYDTLSLPDSVTRLLTTSGKEYSGNNPVNKLLAPAIYKNIARLSWLDEDGNTIAKWNPFDYDAPFTNLSSYDFFQLLQQQPAELSAEAGKKWPVAYPGKSNLTDEFYSFIAKYSNRRFHHITGDCGVTQAEQKSYCVGVAAIMYCSMQPVIPKGFAFSLIDEGGRVLIDSDPTRDLRENLFEESGNAEGLRSIIQLKNPSIFFGMQLYGEPCLGRSVPIPHQPMYLVCYYDQKILVRNLFRFLHFTIGSLFCIFILVTLCLLLATFDVWKPAQLLFNPDKKEWIRPSWGNNYNNYTHAYTLSWFSFLGGLSVLFFILIEVFSTGLNNIFYISILLPLYAIWGFILSRKGAAQYRPDPAGSFPRKKETAKQRLYRNAAIFRDGIYPVFGIVVANFIVLNLVTVTRPMVAGFVMPILFQLFAIVFLRRCHARPVQDWKNAAVNVQRNYQYSLYLSILLLGLLPTIGVLTYGFYAEKIQFKKDKLIKLGNSFFQRANYLQTDLIHDYKTVVRQVLDSAYLDSLVFRHSIYLYDQDSISMVSLPTDNNQAAGAKPGIPGRALPDALYTLLMDKVYLSSPVWGDDVSIQDSAGDNSWSFDLPQPTLLTKARIRYRPMRWVDTSGRRIVLETSLQKPMADLFHLPLFVTIIFLALIGGLAYLAKKVIDGMVFRLFLQDFSSSDKIETNSGYLRQYLNAETPRQGYLKGFQIPQPLDTSFFMREKSFDDWDKGRPACSQQEFILSMTDCLASIYETIWKSLNPEEQYVLFDFSIDRYTNYKNSGTISRLISKGILIRDDGVLSLFSLSFRQYILSKKDTKEIALLKARFSVAGTWENIRIPILSLIAVVAIFIVKTQADFTNNLIAILTTVTTLIPLVLKMVSPAAPMEPEDKAIPAETPAATEKNSQQI